VFVCVCVCLCVQIRRGMQVELKPSTTTRGQVGYYVEVKYIQSIIGGSYLISDVPVLSRI